MFGPLLRPVCVLGLLLAPCVAQSQDTSSSASSGAKPATPATQSRPSTEKKKPKKVWTNEEVGSLRGGVSVVGDGDSPAKKGGDSERVASTGGDEARQRQIQNYRKQIQQLRAQIDAADKRIVQLRNFKADGTDASSGINPNRGYNMVPLEEQVKQLEDKKKQLQAKIDDVENDARKNGIEPGELR
jgi:uncharacterized protein (DUF342 family)